MLPGYTVVHYQFAVLRKQYAIRRLRSIGLNSASCRWRTGSKNAYGQAKLIEIATANIRGHSRREARPPGGITFVPLDDMVYDSLNELAQASVPG